MCQASYWHEYLLARHHTSLILGLVFLSMALISMLTGRCLVKYRGIVSRADDPKTFWQSIFVYWLLSLIFLALYFYTAS